MNTKQKQIAIKIMKEQGKSWKLFQDLADHFDRTQKLENKFIKEVNK